MPAASGYIRLKPGIDYATELHGHLINGRVIEQRVPIKAVEVLRKRIEVNLPEVQRSWYMGAIISIEGQGRRDGGDEG